MQDAIEVVEATIDHVADVSALINEAWRQAGPGAPGFSGANDALIAEISAPDAIKARVGGPDRRMFLARRDGTMVGFSSSRRLTAETVELSGVVVLQSKVGMGIGTPLVEAAIESARRIGFRRMMVSTETDNESALRFYRSLGFTVTGASETQVAAEVLNLELVL